MIIFKDKNGEIITNPLRIEVAKKLIKHIKLDVKLKGNIEAYLNDNPKAWTYF